jgi:hypothetical protein
MALGQGLDMQHAAVSEKTNGFLEEREKAERVS